MGAMGLRLPNVFVHFFVSGFLKIIVFRAEASLVIFRGEIQKLRMKSGFDAKYLIKI